MGPGPRLPDGLTPGPAGAVRAAVCGVTLQARDDLQRSWPTLLALVVQSLLLAFWLGTLSADLGTLKERMGDRASMDRVDALDSRVDRIDDRVKQLERRE